MFLNDLLIEALESVNQLITADHINLITFNIVIKSGLEVL